MRESLAMSRPRSLSFPKEGNATAEVRQNRVILFDCCPYKALGYSAFSHITRRDYVTLLLLLLLLCRRFVPESYLLHYSRCVRHSVPHQLSTPQKVRHVFGKTLASKTPALVGTQYRCQRRKTKPHIHMILNLRKHLACVFERHQPGHNSSMTHQKNASKTHLYLLQHVQGFRFFQVQGPPPIFRLCSCLQLRQSSTNIPQY